MSSISTSTGSFLFVCFLSNKDVKTDRRERCGMTNWVLFYTDYNYVHVNVSVRN